jgi:hypothetical protein
MDPQNGARVLEERNPSAFQLDSLGVRWGDHRLDLEDLQRAREVIVSFGSCSFIEPLSELHALHLLEPRVHHA